VLKKIIALIIALFIFFSVNSGWTKAESIYTDTFFNAIPLSFDSSDELSESNTSGVLNQQGDAKYYSINMQKNGELYFSMQQNPSVEIGVTLYDATGMEYETYYADKGDKVEDLFGQGLVKGNYYIKIFVYEGTGSELPYQLHVTRFYGDDVEYETNNTIETATPIKIGQYYLGYTDQLDTSDLFRFKTNNVGLVNIKGTAAIKSDLNYRLLDEKGRLIEAKVVKASEQYSFSSIFTKQLKPGTYYISVSGDSRVYSNEKYEFVTTFIESIKFEKESNNTLKQANSISSNIQYHGLLAEKADKDIFKFYASTTKYVSVYFNRLEKTAFKIHVINSKGRVVKTYTTKKGNESIVKLGELKLAKGIYYLDVEYFEGESDNVLYQFYLK